MSLLSAAGVTAYGRVLARRLVSSHTRLAHRVGSAAALGVPALARAGWFGAAPAAPPSLPPAWHAYRKPLRLQAIRPHVPRTVPEHIVRPPYARPDWTTDPRRSQHQLRGIEIKDAAGIAGMRRACEQASYIRAYAGSCVRVGRTTDEIDAMVHAEVCRLGSYPSPLGYANFPKSICTSVNQVVCHGIPDARPLEHGDIINIDVSVYDPSGYHGDCSGMFVAGEADPLAANLLETTRACLDGAIALCGPGVPFNAIGAYIQPKAEAAGFTVVREFCGHGIGQTFHMPPLVFHCVNSTSEVMQPGMTFTIEPMLNEGERNIHILDDDWTYVTSDGSRSAQYEETILITETGAEILTRHTRPLPSEASSSSPGAARPASKSTLPSTGARSYSTSTRPMASWLSKLIPEPEAESRYRKMGEKEAPAAKWYDVGQNGLILYLGCTGSLLLLLFFQYKQLRTPPEEHELVHQTDLVFERDANLRKELFDKGETILVSSRFGFKIFRSETEDDTGMCTLYARVPSTRYGPGQVHIVGRKHIEREPDNSLPPGVSPPPDPNVKPVISLPTSRTPSEKYAKLEYDLNSITFTFPEQGKAFAYDIPSARFVPIDPVPAAYEPGSLEHLKSLSPGWYVMFAYMGLAFFGTPLYCWRKGAPTREVTRLVRRALDQSPELRQQLGGAPGMPFKVKLAIEKVTQPTKEGHDLAKRLKPFPIQNQMFVTLRATAAVPKVDGRMLERTADIQVKTIKDRVLAKSATAPAQWRVVSAMVDQRPIKLVL